MNALVNSCLVMRSSLLLSQSARNCSQTGWYRARILSEMSSQRGWPQAKIDCKGLEPNA